MDQVVDTDYAKWHQEYDANKVLVASIKDVPEYYLDGLTAWQVFSHGYYQVAQLAAQRIAKQDPFYILPHQLLGYGALFLGDWSLVINEMTWLKQYDEDNEQLYTFLE